MKKGLVFIGVAVGIIAVYFFVFASKAEQTEETPKQAALVKGKNSEAFNEPFNEMLNGYFALQTALVEWDTAKTATAATLLAVLAAKVPYGELKADTTILETAKSFSDNIMAEAQGIAGETDIEGQRRSFYTLSENLYNLLRTVQYDQQVIYHDKCPMAFNDNEEAFWVSNTKEIVNPYMGLKHPRYSAGMLACGSVEDSIDYRQK